MENSERQDSDNNIAQRKTVGYASRKSKFDIFLNFCILNKSDKYFVIKYQTDLIFTNSVEGDLQQQQ